jgi:hypothetical protein
MTTPFDSDHQIDNVSNTNKIRKHHKKKSDENLESISQWYASICN